jgi:HD superfamily phosphohydrolase
MPEVPSASRTEELGYFYDTIHGRVALEDLPEAFRPALKSALRSEFLNRLKRISQLGHTSVSFFSATHTRFSHAIGTMLVMNKLFQHVKQHGIRDQQGSSEGVYRAVAEHYGKAVQTFGTVQDMVHCHLLLVALYQDVGELPFQKVTSLFFTPVEADVRGLAKEFPEAKPRKWTPKRLFTVLSLLDDLDKHWEGFAGYDRGFLVYLLTGAGAPPGADNIRALLQLVDGVIDADRLDYVYRDAAATIGSLSRPDAVLASVVEYGPNHVVVNDPRPVTDFLSTRMRLWTFVYSSADARFRQVLLKTVLYGRWDRAETRRAFKDCGLDPELPFDEFKGLDDNSLMERIGRLSSQHLDKYRKRAKDLLLHGSLGYECRVLKHGSMDTSEPSNGPELPDEMFFDLLSDHGNHQLYRRESVLVRQALTSKVAKMDTVRLEDSAGAFSPLFSGTNSAMLVPGGYYIFLPPERERQGTPWQMVEDAIKEDKLYPLVVWEDARRDLACPSDTCTDGFQGKAIAISYCTHDYPVIARVVRELFLRKRRYRIFLRPVDGPGDTPPGNSEALVRSAEAVLAVVSVEYLRRALNGKTCISAEVRAMHDRGATIPIVPIGVDERRELNAVGDWDWGAMNEAWRGNEVVIPNEYPLRTATEEILRQVIDEALGKIDKWNR